MGCRCPPKSCSLETVQGNHSPPYQELNAVVQVLREGLLAWAGAWGLLGWEGKMADHAAFR